MRSLIFLATLSSAALTAATCDSLSTLSLPHATITAAQAIAPGAFTPTPAAKGGNPFANLPEFCRVTVTSKPSADSDIKIEYWLPLAANWNNNFLANGNGGWTGSITPNTLATGLRKGFASAMSDLGHEGGSASFALGHPEKVADFGHRATHEMAVIGKEVVKAFYGKPATYTYFDGCSAGGRQAMMEAQRYPDDFNGIVAGSPGLNWSGRAAQAVWVGQMNRKDDAHTLPAAKFGAIHEAVLAACDTNDGVKDGVLENPRKCQFDPAVMTCKAGDAPNCLTAEQVETVRRIYSDVVNPRTKQSYFPGHEPGSEMGWNTMAGAQPFGPGVDLFKYVVFQKADWDYKTLNFDADMEAMRKSSAEMDAMNTNLKPFFDKGGKLVQYHGWADPQISPRSSVEYYEAVLKQNGKKTMDNYRLFLVPGMAHCQGGDGTSVFDMLDVTTRWVEKKEAPAQVAASRARDGKTDRTRPLCPYPQTAVYKGTGSTDEAASFACKE